MQGVLLGLRVLLALVLGVASLTKLVDRASAQRAVLDLGVPPKLALPVAASVPIIEIAVAALLLSPAPSRWGGLAAMLLLLAFAIALSNQLVRGRRPECHCFGKLTNGPAGWMTVFRNMILSLAAGFVAFFAPARGDYRFPALSAAEVAAISAGIVVCALLLVLFWLCIQLLRQHGRLLIRIEYLEQMLGPGYADGLSPRAQLRSGSPAPDVSFRARSNSPLNIETLRAGRMRLLFIFLDNDCSACLSMLAEVADWRSEHAEPQIALIWHGLEDSGGIVKHGLGDISYPDEPDAFHAYGVDGTPSAVLVDSHGRISAPIARGKPEIGRLHKRATQALDPDATVISSSTEVS